MKVPVHKICKTDVLFPPLWRPIFFHSSMILVIVLGALFHHGICYQHIFEHGFFFETILAPITHQNPNLQLLRKRKLKDQVQGIKGRPFLKA